MKNYFAFAAVASQATAFWSTAHLLSKFLTHSFKSNKFWFSCKKSRIASWGWKPRCFELSSHHACSTERQPPRNREGRWPPIHWVCHFRRQYQGWRLLLLERLALHQPSLFRRGWCRRGLPRFRDGRRGQCPCPRCPGQVPQGWFKCCWNYLC